MRARTVAPRKGWKLEFPATDDERATIGAGLWILTLAKGACAVCGFTPRGWHYINRHGEQHCGTCHAIGKDWIRADDSERPVEGVHYI